MNLMRVVLSVLLLAWLTFRLFEKSNLVSVECSMVDYRLFTTEDGHDTIMFVFAKTD